MIAVTHVYSNSNAGDGLLAQLTADLLRDVGVDRPAIIAVDAKGMQSLGRVLTYGGRARSAIGAARELAATAHIGRTGTAEVIRASGRVFATGGAYLRATTARESAVLSAVHLPQLALETETPDQTVFLPQSIGPLPAPILGFVRWRLRRARRVFVRDDRSLALLAGVPNVERMPDLAALAIGAQLCGRKGDDRFRGEQVLLQVRPLPRVPDFGFRVRSLMEELGSRAQVALQSSAGSANNDAPFTAQSTGATTCRSVDEVLGAVENRVGVAVCGRLHAALACILAGVPALHIPYERKSYGVFEDLGLRNYLLAPSSVGSRRCMDLLEGVLEDPSAYWTALDAEIPWLLSRNRRLIEVMEDAIERKT